MEITEPTEWPVWECPVCGIHRSPDESESGWRTTLNLPSREYQPVLLTEGVKGVVTVWHESQSFLSGPWANWRAAEQAARAWMTAN